MENLIIKLGDPQSRGERKKKEWNEGKRERTNLKLSLQNEIAYKPLEIFSYVL